MRDAAAQLPRPRGFVPTMGALHAGHLALVVRAQERSASVAVSLFVNPLQFRAGEDFERYPRDFDADRSALERSGVDLLFAPEASAMYPTEFSTEIDPGEVGERFEGAFRPGHFRGVATVVVKLLNLVDPDVLYLGQKDAQQAAVLRRVLRDLDMRARIEIVETLREPSGLALSSRNAYLSERERAAAPALHECLLAMRAALERGLSKEEALAQARPLLAKAATPDYIDVVDAESFAPIDALRAPAFIIGAARFGSTRLVDNLWIPS